MTLEKADWHYAAGGSRLGPYSTSQIRAFIASGTIGPDTLVWSGGMAGWTRAAATELVVDLRERQRPFSETGHLPADSPPPSGQPGGPAPWRGFDDAVKHCFSSYFAFSERASRSEYWFFMLFMALGYAVAMAADVAFGVWSVDGGVGLVSGIFSLVVLIPSLAVLSRRMHDVGWSFWWVLPCAITGIGMIFIAVLTVLPPEPRSNRFG